jgi:hypothetical protein
MKLSSTKRPLRLGLALAVTGAAGAAAAVTLAVTSPAAPQTPPVVPAAQTSPAGAVPSIAPAAAPSAPAAPAAAAPTVISLDQARGIAERAGNGQADKVAVDSGPAGITYDVSVIRSDGTDVELIIDGHSGRILSNIAEPQSLQDSNAPDPQDGTD